MTDNDYLPADCIIPAAGFSSRMKGWKALLEDQDRTTFLESAVRKALGACERVLLVGGYRFETVKKIIKTSERVILLENTGYPKGMLSSIQTALGSVERDFFITPVDMPGIQTGHYRTLYSFFDKSRIIRPVFKGQPGHPILCPFCYRDMIRDVNGERLIDVLRHWECVDLPWPDQSVVADIDTPEDYEKWKHGLF